MCNKSRDHVNGQVVKLEKKKIILTTSEENRKNWPIAVLVYRF